MQNNHWKRFNTFQQCLSLFFVINLFLDVINNKILNSAIPSEIVDYMFWLSLGLFLGFMLCKYEYRQSLRKHSDEQKLN